MVQIKLPVMESWDMKKVGEKVVSHPFAEEKVSAQVVFSTAILAEGNIDVMGYIRAVALNGKHGGGDVGCRRSRQRWEGC